MIEALLQAVKPLLPLGLSGSFLGSPLAFKTGERFFIGLARGEGSKKLGDGFKYFLPFILARVVTFLGARGFPLFERVLRTFFTFGEEEVNISEYIVIYNEKKNLF